MIHTVLCLLTFVVVGLAPWSGLQAQEFAGGSGTAADPWLVQTAVHLDHLRDFLGAEHGDQHFELLNDLDLTGEFLPGGLFHHGGQGWLPIGSSLSQAFSGRFDGAGHAISGLFIDRNADYQGLFGYAVDARIEDIAVEAVEITGRNIVGALVAFNRGTVSGARSSGQVSGGYRVGGLVGENNPGVVEFSSSSAAINANDGRIGGLVGFNVGGAVANCFATGPVTGGWYVGGLVGRNLNGTVHRSLATGPIQGGSSAGGLVGDTEGGVIADSYARGDVTASNWFAGGLIGYLWSTSVSRTYATGRVIGPADSGGLVGYRFGGSVAGSYWDLETSGQAVSAGGLGRTTAQMTYPYAEDTYVGWDLAEVWQADVQGDLNDGYPFLAWQVVDVTGAGDPPPPALALGSYPNPFNPATTIVFDLPRDGHIELAIFSLRGGLIARLVDGHLPAGMHGVRWDGTDLQGRPVPGGVYLSRLAGGEGAVTRKLTLTR